MFQSFNNGLARENSLHSSLLQTSNQEKAIAAPLTSCLSEWRAKYAVKVYIHILIGFLENLKISSCLSFDSLLEEVSRGSFAERVFVAVAA